MVVKMPITANVALNKSQMVRPLSFSISFNAQTLHWSFVKTSIVFTNTHTNFSRAIIFARAPLSQV